MAALLVLGLTTTAGAQEPAATGETRIVSIGGAVTEIVYALGAGDEIVAVDTTSTYPAAASEKPKVGYMRALAAEGILSTDPTIILAAAEAGPPEVLTVLRQAAVPLVVVPDDPTPAGIADKIRTIASALGREERGEEIADAVSADFETLADLTQGLDKPTVAFVLAMRDGAPMVGGAGTSADSILALAAASNAFSDMTGFKPASAEATLVAAPEAIVTMNRGAHGNGADAITRSPAFARTPAVRAGRIQTVDGTYMLGFGPRTAHAARDLAALVHPDAKLAELPDRPWIGQR